MTLRRGRGLLAASDDVPPQPRASTAWGPDVPDQHLLARRHVRRGHVEGRCPAGPDEALIDPTMLRTIEAEVGDTITVVLPRHGDHPEGQSSTVDIRHRASRSSAPTPSTTTPTRHGSTRAAPAGTAPCGRRPLGSTQPPRGSGAAGRPVGHHRAPSVTSVAPTGRSTSTGSTSPPWTTPSGAAHLAGRDRRARGPRDLRATTRPPWTTSSTAVRAEQTLLSRVTLAAVVPLIVLALLLLYVLVARRPRYAARRSRWPSCGASRPARWCGSRSPSRWRCCC